MNTIKDFFKKMWKTVRNFFSIDSVNIDAGKNKNVSCNCKPKHNCDKGNCKCIADNKNTEQQNKDYEQLTIFDDVDCEKSEEVQKDTVIRYTDETVTRDILIAELRKNNVTGISRLKKAELLVRFHELGLEFPEVK